VSAFLLALSNGYGWGLAPIIIFAITTVGLLIYLCILKQENVPHHTFKCPLVPLFPCIGIFFSFVLVSSLDLTSWLYFIGYEVIGIAFYFGYGLRNSELKKEQEGVQLT